MACEKLTGIVGFEQQFAIHSNHVSLYRHDALARRRLLTLVVGPTLCWKCRVMQGGNSSVNMSCFDNDECSLLLPLSEAIRAREGK